MNSLRLFLVRLPKNLQSNRFWIIWAGTLFLRRPRPTGGPRLPAGEFFTVWHQTVKRYPSVDPVEVASLVPHLGRFGNTTVRLAGTIAEATNFGLGHVVVPKTAVFQEGLYKNGVHVSPGSPTIWFATHSDRSAPRPRFLLLKDERIRRSIDPESQNTAQSSAWAQLASMLRCEPAPQALPRDHLVIHLRGGDVFGPRRPRTYGQPPLAYYEFVLTLEQWSAVTVVHEDGGNPVLEPMVSLLGKLGIDYQLQSSNRLLDDLGVLLSARTLVAGRGTFIPAVAGLSRNLERIYYFENKCVLDASLTHLSVHRVYDAEGSYTRSVLSDNWHNTPAQREMMTGYPLGALAVETIQPS